MEKKETGKRAVMLDRSINKIKEREQEQRRAKRRRKFKRKPLR